MHNAQSIPSVAIPPRSIFSGICHLVGPSGGELVRKPLPGGGAFVNSSRRGSCRSFFSTSLKNMNIQIALAIAINNIFNTVLCFKIVVFTPSLPYPPVCFGSVPPSSAVRMWMKNNQCIV